MRGFWPARLLYLLVTSWSILSIIFLLSRSLSAGQLVEQLVGEAGLARPDVSAATQAAMRQQARERLGLATPLFYFSLRPATPGTPAAWQWHGRHNQYHTWLRALASGDLGDSYHNGQPVTTLLWEALQNTLPLTLSAVIMAGALAFWLAPWAAAHPRWEQVVLLPLFLLDALPLFVVALLLLLLFANPALVAWFPAYGLGFASPTDAWLWRLTDYLYHLALPVGSLVLVTLPALAVQLHQALRQELTRDYTLTARAKGLALRQIIRRHALRNALLPILTLLVDTLPALVGGAVVVEYIFAIPGVGRLLAQAAASHDFPVLLGGVLLTAVVRLLAYLLGDWLYAQADPRVIPHS